MKALIPPVDTRLAEAIGCTDPNRGQCGILPKVKEATFELADIALMNEESRIIDDRRMGEVLSLVLRVQRNDELGSQ